MRKLVAHLNGTIAGHFVEEDDGHITFSYTPEWVEMKKRNQAHQISMSLPVVAADMPQDASAFVAGLLPDSARHRTLIAEEIGIGDDPSDFAFLSKIGKDSAGALMILPEHEAADYAGKPNVEWLNESQIAERLRSLPRRPLFIDEHEGVALSLAGVNDKAAVVYRKGQIGLPQNGFPSTHIIKIDIPGLEDSVKTEHFCLLLAKAVGFRVPKTQLLTAEDQTFMLMQRYDRIIKDDKLTRVHQEDFCQALNVMPAKKYQRYGGPGWADCFRLMNTTSDVMESHRTLLQMSVFQFLIGNPDAHAKNYSLVYKDAKSGVALSPLYDLNNAAAFRKHFKSAKPLMAMFIGTKSNRDEVDIKDWYDFAEACKISPDIVLGTIESLSEGIIKALPDVQSACPDCEAIRIAADDIKDRCEQWLSLLHEHAEPAGLGS